MQLIERFLRRVPQYTRNARHLRAVLEHGNARKWTNLALAELERRLRRIRLRSHPYLLIIDPCNLCNLRCPLCPTGLGELGRPQRMLSLEQFKDYFEPLAPYLFEAYLHNWGESLLNKEVYSMIAHAQSRNVGTNLSSNLVSATSEDLDRLLDCGLEYLIVSLDGVSPEVYSQYRIRGDFQKVVDNMAELLRRRRIRGRKHPFIEWQFIVMRQNEHQVAEAGHLARQLGVDLLRFIPVGMPFEFRNRREVADRWFPNSVRGRAPSTHEEKTFGQTYKPGACFYLYRSLVINSDGGVSPCCEVYRKERDFAQLNGAPFRVHEVWNNDRFLAGRSLFSPRELPGRTPTVCEGCDIFRKHPRKAAQPGKAS